MRIPRWPIADQRERELIEEVLGSRQWGGFHEFVPRFEQQFAEFHQCRYGISAVNGTLTLEMALSCAGIKPGDEVIVPSISFISTATAVSRVGAIPVFVDIEPYTFNIDPARRPWIASAPSPTKTDSSSSKTAYCLKTTTSALWTSTETNPSLACSRN